MFRFASENVHHFLSSKTPANTLKVHLTELSHSPLQIRCPVHLKTWQNSHQISLNPPAPWLEWRPVQHLKFHGHRRITFCGNGGWLAIFVGCSKVDVPFLLDVRDFIWSLHCLFGKTHLERIDGDRHSH